MNDLFKRLRASLTALWAKWTTVQKMILFGIVAAALAAVIFVFSYSTRPTGVPLFGTAIADGAARDNIAYRLDEENIPYTINAAGIITVSDQATARRAKAILVREDLLPTGTDPWNLFDIPRWTIDDMTQKANLRRSIQNQLVQHITALDDVDKAAVVVTMPEKAAFSDDQKPVTASVSLTKKPGSDIYANRKKIEGIQKLIKFAVEGLDDKYIVITDSAGNVLNNFDDKVIADLDRLGLIKREQELIAELEAKYTAKILAALQSTFTEDRVRALNVRYEMDMSERTSDATVYTPIVIREDNKDTPYDDSEFREYLPLESQTVTKKWTGTALMPEGPAGTEGQNPPVYADTNTMVGTSEETGVTQRNVINTETIRMYKHPSPERVTVSVNIDGTWKKKYDEKRKPIILADGSIEREYIPVEPSVLADVADLVHDAIGYKRERDDSVTVRNIAFDRTRQFLDEDLGVIRAMERTRMIYLSLGGVAAVLVAFMVFRFVAKERERRRRLKEEELLRKRQMERDKSLWDAEQGAMEVTMSVEERRRAELQENAIAAAKEHPEDVAQLIRTWLMEE
jgi:flagellar M-ring protein FliF